jgi:hypothetical protein
LRQSLEQRSVAADKKNHRDVVCHCAISLSTQRRSR